MALCVAANAPAMLTRLRRLAAATRIGTGFVACKISRPDAGICYRRQAGDGFVPVPGS